MEVQLQEVEDKIKKASEGIDDLFALEKSDKARFDSTSVQDRIKHLTKREEDLRKEKLLLLEISRTPAPPGNSITLPQVLPLSFITLFSSLPPPLFLQNSLHQ